MNRQIVLDIETTGMNLIDKPYIGHKIIEIGAIEIINKKITGNFLHLYINPKQKIDKQAYNIHGISNDFLKKKPIFSKISNKIINFIKKSDLIIHNANFDIGFIENELKNINHKIKKINKICNIIDTLSIARKKFPGKKNDLNSLCQRYKINNSIRKKHGALIDAKLLAIIFLNMNKKQIQINFKKKTSYKNINLKYKNYNKNIKLLINKKDNEKHIKYLKYIKKKFKKCLWMDIK